MFVQQLHPVSLISFHIHNTIFIVVRITIKLCSPDALTVGPNAIGAMLGHGWKNNTAFHPLDANEPETTKSVLIATVCDNGGFRPLSDVSLHFR